MDKSIISAFELNVSMENMNSLASCEEEVLLLCRKYDISRPTVHEAMRDAEQLNNIFTSRSVSLILECRLVTAVASHPCFVPENPLNAEVQVNSLLPYLSSPCRWGRSLACSLLRVFATGLDPKGQHLQTQSKGNYSARAMFPVQDLDLLNLTG